MQGVAGIYRVAVVVALSLLSACAQTDSECMRFDIAAQPAATALNEFAREADVVLIFSYDLVSGVHTRSLQGRLPVDEGLARLLRDTGLSYRRSGDDIYMICTPGSCGLPVELAVRRCGELRSKGSGGNRPVARLHDKAR